MQNTRKHLQTNSAVASTPPFLSPLHSTSELLWNNDHPGALFARCLARFRHTATHTTAVISDPYNRSLIWPRAKWNAKQLAAKKPGTHLRCPTYSKAHKEGMKSKSRITSLPLERKREKHFFGVGGIKPTATVSVNKRPAQYLSRSNTFLSTCISNASGNKNPVLASLRGLLKT